MVQKLGANTMDQVTVMTAIGGIATVLRRRLRTPPRKGDVKW